jgi:hypothetical protein
VIRVYDEAGNLIEDARARGRFQRAVAFGERDLLSVNLSLLKQYKGTKMRRRMEWQTFKQLTASCLCAGFRCSSSRSFL